ncbi:MAG: hypothetical protein LBV40_03230 [Methanomicrobiales archaeon]|jgi:hypothetical protein|nr:hypothetical protein [Methanomicrobiales archaeon]
MIEEMAKKFLASPEGQKMIMDFLLSDNGKKTVMNFMSDPKGKQTVVSFIKQIVSGLDLPEDQKSLVLNALNLLS